MGIVRLIFLCPFFFSDLMAHLCYCFKSGVAPIWLSHFRRLFFLTLLCRARRFHRRCRVCPGEAEIPRWGVLLKVCTLRFPILFFFVVMMRAERWRFGWAGGGFPLFGYADPHSAWPPSISLPPSPPPVSAVLPAKTTTAARCCSRPARSSSGTSGRFRSGAPEFQPSDHFSSLLGFGGMRHPPCQISSSG